MSDIEGGIDIDIESKSLPPIPDDINIFKPNKYHRSHILTGNDINGDIISTPNIQKRWFPLPIGVGGVNGGYNLLKSNLIPSNRDIWIVSFPSSGSSWVKELIEQLLDIKENDTARYDGPLEIAAGGEGGEEFIDGLNKGGKNRVRVFEVSYKRVHGPYGPILFMY